MSRSTPGPRGGREREHLPQPRDPRPHGDHDLPDRDRPRRGLHKRDGAGAIELEAGDLDALLDLRPRRARLGREAEHRVAVVGEAAGPLVQADAEPRGAPVVEERAHVRRDLGLAEDELRRVADLLLALVDGREVVDLGAIAQGDVPRAVGERLGVGLPDLHARGHQLRHRRLEVVVADAASVRSSAATPVLDHCTYPPCQARCQAVEGCTARPDHGTGAAHVGGRRLPARHGGASSRRRCASPRPGRARAGGTWRGPPSAGCRRSCRR